MDFGGDVEKIADCPLCGRRPLGTLASIGDAFLSYCAAIWLRKLYAVNRDLVRMMLEDERRDADAHDR